MRNSQTPIIYLDYTAFNEDTNKRETVTRESEIDPESLRASEKELVFVEGSNDSFDGIAIYDLRNNT